MTWAEIRAAYPPATWLVLEVVETEWAPPWQHFAPVRVLDVVPTDSDPMALYRKHRAQYPPERLTVATTSDEVLATEVVFMGFCRVVDATDLGSPAMRVINLRASRSRGPGSARGG